MAEDAAVDQEPTTESGLALDRLNRLAPKYLG